MILKRMEANWRNVLSRARDAEERKVRAVGVYVFVCCMFSQELFLALKLWLLLMTHVMLLSYFISDGALGSHANILLSYSILLLSYFLPSGALEAPVFFHHAL